MTVYRVVENFLSDILRHRNTCNNFELRFTNVFNGINYKKYSLICSCNTPFIINFLDMENSGYDPEKNYLYKLITESDKSRELLLSSMRCDHGISKEEMTSCKTCLVNGVMRL